MAGVSISRPAVLGKAGPAPASTHTVPNGIGFRALWIGNRTVRFTAIIIPSTVQVAAPLPDIPVNIVQPPRIIDQIEAGEYKETYVILKVMRKDHTPGWRTRQENGQ